MAVHTNLIIEDDKILSSKIGRVLFVDFDKNPDVILNLEDTIKHGNETLKIKSVDSIRTHSSEGTVKPVVGIRVESL